MRPDLRLDRGIAHEWHVAVNRLDMPHETTATTFDPAADGKSFMYEAMTLADEVSRIALVFGLERKQQLVKTHRQCSHDTTGSPVVDNHVECCLGVECRACPFLLAIEGVKTRREYRFHPSVEVAVTDEERDVMKAWTCATHIVSRGGDKAGEGYVLTTDDRMYWSNLYARLAMSAEEAQGDEPSPDAL